MARSKFGKVKIDRAGVQAVLRSGDVADMVHGEAVNLASELRTDPAILRNTLATLDGIKVDDYTTDRAASSVTITHASGVAIQAKHGSLTGAAERSGLEVKQR
jgi:hypothetical protein